MTEPNFVKYDIDVDFCGAPLDYIRDDTGKFKVQLREGQSDNSPYIGEITKDNINDGDMSIFWGDSDLLKQRLYIHFAQEQHYDQTGFSHSCIAGFLDWVLNNVKFWKLASYPYTGGPYAEISDLDETVFYQVNFEEVFDIIHEIWSEDPCNFDGEQDEAPDFVPDSLKSYYFKETIFEKIPDYVLKKESPSIKDIVDFLSYC